MTPNAQPAEAPVLVCDLAARYGNREVLSGVNLAIAPGEIRVILGSSGCGKSTLLKHMVGLLEPAEGSVRLLGTLLAEADEGERQMLLGRVGVLFQGGALLNSLTVLENVTLPLREKAHLTERVMRDVAAMKLDMVGLGGVLDLTPRELSGGMKKRAALARAMALDPEVLFCDEPSAGLDPVTSAGLDELLLSLRDRFGMAIVVVTHELFSIDAIADRVLMLARGRVLFDGSLAEVKQSDHPDVVAFFGRKARRDSPGATMPSVLDSLQ